MSKGSKGSWSLPSYSSSGIIDFSNPLGSTKFTQGTTGVNSGTFGFEFNPETQDYYNQLTAMRNAILSGLGYTSDAREASLNKWQDTFTKEALRTTQPQLEQSLFARGLGGSRYYSDSLTDLLTKVATQGVLNRENLALQDENLKLQQLASINPEVANLINQANSLSQNSYAATENQYQNLFPYLATWNKGKSGTMDILGGALGATAGLIMGGPAGAVTGYQLGSSLGSGFNTGPQSSLGQGLNSLASIGSIMNLPTTGLNLNSLWNLFGSKQIKPASTSKTKSITTLV